MSDMRKVSEMTPEEIKDEVKKAYSRRVKRTGHNKTTNCCSQSESATRGHTTSDCCGSPPRGKRGNVESVCCDSGKLSGVIDNAASLGYELSELPVTSTQSFAGCGNPMVFANVQEGEVVLDLGSGAGLDAFVASKKVGTSGRVIGVDMTPDMLDIARANAHEHGYANVEFREGDIERMPVDDNSVDVIISNCVINLAPDKQSVFNEAYRVLRPRGRLLVSDIVLLRELPEAERDDLSSYTGCLGGAILEEDYLSTIQNAGFERVTVLSRAGNEAVVSATIAAYKPTI